MFEKSLIKAGLFNITTQIKLTCYMWITEYKKLTQYVCLLDVHLQGFYVSQ